MKTTALIEKGTDGTFTIFTHDLQHTTIGEGDTVEEAKADFENSVTEMIRSYGNQDLPKELKDLDFQFKYDISSMFDYFRFVNVTQFAKTAGISPSLLRQYKAGNTYISERQITKIETALHKIGRELSTVKLVYFPL